MKNEIKVSVICITYNHAPYIRDTLDGFVNQKTDFNFQVLIHDDASQDETADIIREYVEKYPGIFTAVLQKENQYSKGIKISKTYLYPLIKGDYIAFCEGDDFWIDDRKLQKQVDFMEENQECIACIGGAKVIDYSNDMSETYAFPTEKNRYISTSEAIMNGAVYPTATYLYRTEFLKFDNMFDGLNLNFGDYVSIINYTLAGKLYAFHDVFSVYRYKTPGSWTEKNDNDISGKVKIKNNLIKMFKCLNENTNNEYVEYTNRVILNHEFNILKIQEDFKGMKADKYKDLYNANFGYATKTKKILLKYFPQLKKIKNLFKGKK